MIIIKDEIYNYLPIHINSIFISKRLSLYTSLEASKIKAIFININKDDIYILDFYGLKDIVTSASIKELIKGAKSRRIIFINMPDSLIYQVLIESKIFKLKENINREKYIVTKDSLQLPDNTIYKKFNYLKKYLINCLKENAIYGAEYLKSSNVYSNYFFDLKNMFYDINFLQITVYLISQYIFELNKHYFEKDGKKLKLITSNFNSSIVANLVAMIMKMEHISVLHIGPDKNEEDNRFIDEIERNDKFIYIYDFIGLGNEQRKIKTILRIKEAEIYKAIGIAYYKIYEEDESNIMQILDLKDAGIIMKCTSEKEDIKKL